MATEKIKQIQKEFEDFALSWTHKWIHAHHEANGGECPAPHTAFMYMTNVIMNAYEEAMENLHREEHTLDA